MLIEQHNKQRVLDQAYYDEQWEKHCVAHRLRHDEAVADKVNCIMDPVDTAVAYLSLQARLARMTTSRDLFYEQIMMKRRTAHKALVDHYNNQVQKQEIERF